VDWIISISNLYPVDKQPLGCTMRIEIRQWMCLSWAARPMKNQLPANSACIRWGNKYDKTSGVPCESEEGRQGGEAVHKKN